MPFSAARALSSRVDGWLALVAGLHQRRRDDEVSRRAVAGDWHIPHHGDAQQRLHVWIVGLRLERVPEENEAVDAALGDARADLLVAAQRPALKALHLEVELLLEQAAGGPRREQLVLGQQVAVEARPLEELALLAVVRDERDAPPRPPVRGDVVHAHGPTPPARRVRRRSAPRRSTPRRRPEPARHPRRRRTATAVVRCRAAKAPGDASRRHSADGSRWLPAQTPADRAVDRTTGSSGPRRRARRLCADRPPA